MNMANSLHSFGSRLRVTILATEWGSSKGALSSINRELAIQLAKFPEVEITFFLPKCSEEGKHEALSHNIRIVEAAPRIGYEEIYWLSFPPDDLQIDVIVGYGVELGRQGQVIRESHKCKWFQIVDTVSGELKMDRTPTKKREKYETELELGRMADFVLGLGQKTSDALRACFRWCQKAQTVLDITPGVFDNFVNVKHDAEDREWCGVLVFGRGDAEDFHLKGFDIAGKAVAQLHDARLYFFGAPEGKQEEVVVRFLECGIPANRLIVRSFHERHDSLKRLFCEVDLVLVPSRAEEFGLAGQLAFSAGLPVLVSRTSGFGEALRQVPFGRSCVIDSDDTEVWAQAMKNIWNKDRELRLAEAEVLRSSYQEKYSWAKQSQGLVEKMISITNGMIVKGTLSRWQNLKKSG